MGTQEEERLLLEDGIPQEESNGLYTGDGSVDIKGNPVLKSNTGNWKACPFILGTECCERLAYYGIATNLVSYLTKKLHEGNVSAARDVTTWQGTCYLAPLIGAILADTFWGRYWTIAVFSTIYFINHKACSKPMERHEDLIILQPTRSLMLICYKPMLDQSSLF